jgi:DNA-binding XRE family transcriptional regulator
LPDEGVIRLKKKVGKIIATLRTKKGFTQEALAKAINSSIPTIWRWENDESEPRASDITKLCEVLNVTEAELLNGPAPNEIKFTIIWEVDKEMNVVDVKMNEFKIGRGEDDDFGCFRFSKDTTVEEIGRQFMNHLRAARTSRETYDAILKKLEGGA